MRVQIIGTEQEIEWAKTALLNNCDVCPYRGACDQRAKEELEQYGKVKFSCREYLKKEIEFVIQS